MVPKQVGLFPRTEAFRRLFKENINGRFIEYCCLWYAKYKADAVRATADEKNSLVRGGKVAKHILMHVPVIIEPQDLFATFGLVPRSWDTYEPLYK